MKNKKVKIAIVGGGSTWTPGILKGLCKNHTDLLPLKEVIMYDTNHERQAVIGEFGKILFAEECQDVTFSYTTKAEEAYRDADFVFCQMRTGGYKMRALDEHIPLSMNIIGQETCGPGGFAYGLRSIKDMIEMVETVRHCNKDAWIINYTNPAAIVAYALKKQFPNDDKIINICDQPVNLLRSYGRLLNQDMKAIEPVYFGLNHFGWFTNLYTKDGIDLVPQLKNIILKDGFIPVDAEQRDQSWLDTYAMVKDMLEDFPEYLPNTYLQYYLYPEYKLSKMNKDVTRADEVMANREKKVFEACHEVIQKQTTKGSYLVHNDAHSDMIIEIASSIHYNKNKYFIVMVENNGIINNLQDDVMVEVAACVGNHGPRAFHVGTIPTFYKGLIENQYAYERLTVEAYFEKSYQKALQALTLNRTVNDAKKARKVLDALIEANHTYFPTLK